MGFMGPMGLMGLMGPMGLMGENGAVAELSRGRGLGPVGLWRLKAAARYRSPQRFARDGPAPDYGI